MRVWTVQPGDVLATLEQEGRLTGDWQRVAPGVRPAYEVMVAEMHRRGIDCGGRPPVWAWAEPDAGGERVLLTAQLLLSPVEWERGVVVLDLDVPDASVLCSAYGRWNDFLCDVLEGAPAPAMNWAIGPDDERGSDCRVQACLPVVRASWVVGIRPLEPGPEPEGFVSVPPGFL
ncbi:DUF3841 domain-containing protein [Streptomyces sp. NPDC020742]|uniref:DUF3841 domain-containing protein n=1 Tax=Streptomyces sp. NPDC020742 TaxID=3154897 RepID=UPI0033C96958